MRYNLLDLCVLFFVSLYSTTRAMSNINSCHHCDKKIDVNCSVVNLTDSTEDLDEYRIVCDSLRHGDCPEKESSKTRTCYSDLVYDIGNKNWKFQASLIPSDLQLVISCPEEYTVSTYDEIFEKSFRCHCIHDNNCNKLRNFTVFVNSSLLDDQVEDVTLLMLSTNAETLITVPSSSLAKNSDTTSSSGNILSNSISSGSVMSSLPVSSSVMSSPIDNELVPSSVDDAYQEVFIGVIAALVFTVIIIFTMLILAMFIVYRNHISKRSQHSIRIHTPPPVYDASFETESFPITILNTIGYGKFGTVYKGIYNGNPVAVKVFSSHHFNSWNNEQRIYTCESVLHENILRFIGCEQRGNGSRRQLYMMTEYHALGSLSRFLQQNKLTWLQVLKICHSVSCGLAHLHSTSYITKDGSTEQKFAIAHRDFKSPNILVKDSGGHCVIGDLGLALILDPNTDDRQMANSGQVGTYRYMAPEALDARVNLRDIESFKQIDVYALALVLWEVCTRCEIDDNLVPPYQSPYFSLVGERPTLELMKHVVVVEKSRPHIMGCWESHPGLKQVINIMEESWDEDPEARLTAANIVSRLEALERTQRKEELMQELDSVSSIHSLSHTSSVREHRTRKKVRISSSFSGQPCHNLPVVQRLSVGNNDSQHNTILAFQQRYNQGSLNQHSEVTEGSDNNNQSNSSITAESTDLQNSVVNPPSMNIDAATGQPSVIDEQSISITTSSADQTDSL